MMMPSEKRFAEVNRMLEQAGYRLVRIRGSHHYFAKAGELPLSIPVHQGKVKSYYVRQVENICKGD
ncbi:MAG: type II toxin-antitoxin system HicA family toxin [Thermoguttaceae bacterium]